MIYALLNWPYNNKIYKTFYFLREVKIQRKTSPFKAGSLLFQD